MSQLPIALTIAGFDPCGGAGLQADLKTFQAHGVYGLSAATAITVQNTQGVAAVYPLPAAQVSEQLSNLLADFDIRAVKIGMLGSAENARAVAQFLKNSKIKPVVLDPVIASQCGFPLNDEACLVVLQEQLIPQSLLLTPNTEEAARLCGFAVHDREGMRQAAAVLHRMGADYVLIKGGHLEGEESCDLLFDGEDYTFRCWPRIDGSSPHGTGCVLSAAIVANLAHEQTMAQAAANAQNYLQSLHQHPLKAGRGYPLLFPQS